MLPRDGLLGSKLLPTGGWPGILILTIGVAVLLSFNLGGNDVGPGDEGYCGVVALNVSSGVHQLISPSLSPMGPPGDRLPLHGLVLAAAVRLGGVDEIPLRIVSVIFGVLVALLLWLIGQELGSRVAGTWAGILWLTSPMLAHIGRVVESDLLVVVVTLGGVWCFLRSVRSKRWPWALAAGVLFGLGFLTKLWLALIPAGAVVGGTWLANIISVESQRVGWRTWWRLTLLLLCGLVLTGSTQLVACWLITPQHLAHWLRVYFGHHLIARMAETGFAASHKPPLYYLARIARWACLCIPMAGLGAVALIRRRGGNGKWPLAMSVLLVWLLGLVPLSLLSVKDPTYVLPVLPAVFLLAGFGIESLVKHLADSSLVRWQLRVGVLLAVLAAAGSQAILARGHEQDVLNSVIALVVQAAWIAGLLLATARRRGSFLACLAVVGCLSAAVVGGIVQQVRMISTTDHVTGFARIAQVLEPGLRDLDPAQLCFIAPEWPAMSFYTFRSGRNWEAPYVEPDPDLTLAGLRGPDPFFFVVPTRVMDLHGGRPSPQILRTIIAEAYPLNLGPNPPAAVRVYVNEPLRLALAGLGSEK